MRAAIEMPFFSSTFPNAVAKTKLFAYGIQIECSLNNIWTGFAVISLNQTVNSSIPDLIETQFYISSP